MSFSDLFNRVSCKQQKEYQKFQQQLIDIGIDTEEKAKNVLNRSRKNMLIIGLVVIMVSLGTILIWPHTLGITIVFGSLVLLWLILTLLKGQRMLMRFMQQEFSKPEDRLPSSDEEK